MIKEYKNIFTKVECEKIIKDCFVDLKKLLHTNPNSTEANFMYIYDRRITGTVLEKNDLKIEWFMKKLASTIDVDINKLEYPRLKKYHPGGEYKRHFDCVFLDKPYSKVHLRLGGQRIKSHLIYLNDDFEGGETEFPHWNTIIKPERGKIISWSNVKENIPLDSIDSPNRKSEHGGFPIKNGNKYIIIVFEKENEFLGSTKDWFERFKEVEHLHESK